MNFEKYIGIPYVEKGRDETGVDCWGLVRLVYKNELTIDLPSFNAEYQIEDTDRIEELFAQYKEGWECVDKAEIGDVVIFRIFGHESHIGVCVGNNQFLHVREGRDSVVESLDNAKWSKRIAGFFKYSEKKNAVLNTIPHPLKTERYTLAIVPGTTVTELVKDISDKYNIAPELKSRISILLNGRVVAQEKWSETIIKQADVIEYRAVPGKDTVRTLAILAVAFYAPTLALSALGTTAGAYTAAAIGQGVFLAAATAGITLIGSALINAIAPIRPPSMASGSQNDPGSAERQLMVNGGSNRANAYGAIPVVLGKVRVTPLLGSTNFLTYENERDSYLSMLLVWGYGPLSIDDSSYRIGDVPISSFTDVVRINDTRITDLPANNKRDFDSIYGKDVTQVNTAVELVCDGNPEGVISGYTSEPIYQYDWESGNNIIVGYNQVPIWQSVAPGPWFEAVTTQPTTSVTLALHFPQGLRYIKSKGEGAGDSFPVTVYFRAEFSTDDGVSFPSSATFSIGGDTVKKDAFTYTKTFHTNSQKLLVRVRRETGDNTEDNPEKRYYFTSVLQNVTFLNDNQTPAVDPVGAKIAKTAFKIKATDQLNGNIQGISAIVQTYCKIWNGSSWVDGVTSNPAALMRYVLEHPANPKKITNAASQINLTQLQYFYNYCQSRGFEYNGVLGDARSVLEVIRDICAAGRASPALVDGKWTVIIDEAKTNVIQHFTPHNSWNFEGSKALPKRPDGLRVTYYDQDSNYQESEIIVYDISKDSNNASLFESITLPGVTKKSLVIDHARWHLAQMKLRPELYTLESDVEYLVCNRGDRVKVMHDVPMWGLGSGRIKNRISSTVLELDEDMPMQANAQYTIRFRSKTGDSVTRNIVPKTQDGNYNSITLTSSVTTAQADVLDLFLFGTLNQESQDLIVLSIEPSNNKTARITMIDYGVTDTYNIFSDYLNLSASTVFESQITLPPVLQVQGFGEKTPLITGFVSDESVMERVSKGVFKYNINVAYFNASQLPDVVESVEVQYDLASSDSSVNYKSMFVPFQNGSANITDVKEGETYKIRMRYIGRNGRTGNWTSYINHTVVGKTNPPSQVTNFSAVADKASGQLLLSWSNNPEADTYTYEVRTDNTGWGTDETFRIFFGNADNCFAKHSVNTSITYYIKAIDSSGNYSVNSTSFVYTRQAVPNISNIQHIYSSDSLTNATVTLKWNEVTNSEFNVDYYEISYGSVTNTSKSNTITLPTDWIGDRSFTIKTVDINSNKSSGYSQSITKLAPNPPIGFRPQVIDNTVMFYWILPEKTSLPIDHVLLKKGEEWDTAELIGEKKGDFTSVNELQGGTYTYWIASVDTSGVYSTPVEITTIVAEPPDFVFHGDFNSTFSATKSSAVINLNNSLVIPVNTTETWTQHFTSRSWNTPQDQITAGYPVFIQPSASSGYYEEVFDFGQPLASSRVSLTYRGITIAGNPLVTPKISLSLDNSTYIDYNGVTDVFGVNFRYVKIRITVTAAVNTALYEISDLYVRLDAKLKNDAGNVSALSTDALGTIVNFGKEFIDVQSVTVSPSGTTPIIPVYDIKDAFVSGTYSITSNVCTVTINNHGLITGQNVKLFITTSTGVSGIYTITSHTTNSFTVAMTAANTTGSCSMYPQSFRVYLFNNSGTRVSSTISWSIKGY